MHHSRTTLPRVNTMPNTSSLTLLLLASLCAGCGADNSAEPTQPSAAEAVAEQPSAATQPAAGQVYRVDAAASEVLWRISKAGVMARFGHNHVISAEQFSGTVVVDNDDATQSRFELDFPVAELVIDNPALRARFGEEFASVPSEADKEGTRDNMLGEGLLRASTFPAVRVRGGAPEKDASGVETLPITIEILGRSFDLRAPGTVTYGDGTLEASGDFALDHAELGLTPFSALGGALQVGPRIEFSYRIRAVRAAGE
jgi:polyisoprenoid-binding protein YceI